jgi:hypothetical protein
MTGGNVAAGGIGMLGRWRHLASAEHPVAPLAASSPRATLQTLQDHIDRGFVMLGDGTLYRERVRYHSLTIRLLDLRDMPPALVERLRFEALTQPSGRSSVSERASPRDGVSRARRSSFMYDTAAWHAAGGLCADGAADSPWPGVHRSGGTETGNRA